MAILADQSPIVETVIGRRGVVKPFHFSESNVRIYVCITLLFASLLILTSCPLQTHPSFRIADLAFDPPEGEYFVPQEVTISCTTPGATIRFTTDGTDPTEGSPEYTGPITVAETNTIKAKGFKVGMNPSLTSTATYSFRIADLAFDPPEGTYTSAQSVTISCETPNAIIRYTIDGVEPTESSTEYTGALTMSETKTIKAKGYKTGMNPSETAVATYTINSPPNNNFLESFDTYTTGNPPVPPWTDYYWPTSSPAITRAEAEALGVTIRVDDTVYYGLSGKSLHLLDTSGPGSVGIQLDYIGFDQKTHVIVEYYMRTQTLSDEGAFLNLVTDNGGDQAACFRSNGYIGVFNRYAWQADLLQYTTDTWYYVRREIDFTTDTGSFHIEEEGNPSNSVDYAIGEVDPQNYVDGLRIWTSQSVGADCFIDEIVVTFLDP